LFIKILARVKNYYYSHLDKDYKSPIFSIRKISNASLHQKVKKFQSPAFFNPCWFKIMKIFYLIAKIVFRKEVSGNPSIAT